MGFLKNYIGSILKDYKTFGKLICCQLHVFLILHNCLKHLIVDGSYVKIAFIVIRLLVSDVLVPC